MVVSRSADVLRAESSIIQAQIVHLRSRLAAAQRRLERMPVRTEPRGFWPGFLVGAVIVGAFLVEMVVAWGRFMREMG